MTKEQLKLLESKLNKDNGNGRTLALSTQYDLDNGMTFRNNNDFVILDDSNELIYCIAANRQSNIKDEAPYTIISAPYEMLQFTEHNLDLDGLKDALDDLFGSLLKGDQKKIILNWAENLPVHPKNPNVGLDYYKKKAPQITQKPVTDEILKSEAAAHEIDKTDSYIKKIEKQVSSFIAGIPTKNTAYTSVYLTNKNVSLVINSSDNLELGFTEFLAGLEGLKTVEFKPESGEAVTMIIEDQNTYEKFKEGVLKFMPTNQNETATGTFTGTVGEKSVVYTLNVKYYNKEQDKVDVNGKSYASIQDALNDIGTTPATITLKAEITEDITVPAGADVIINLNGNNITNKDSANTITNKGKLTIEGDGTIDNTKHAKACVFTDIGAETTITGGTFVRSLEDSKSNSFYVLQNLGTLVIGSEGDDNSKINVSSPSTFSSMICNEIPDERKPATDPCVLIINSGTFSGGLNTIKNGDCGSLFVNGGILSNDCQNVILNWNKCSVTGGTFNGVDKPCFVNGTYSDDAKGNAEITGGAFTSGTAECLGEVTKYPCSDIFVKGGTYSTDPSKYVVGGYKAVKGNDNIYTVSEATAKEEVDIVMDSLTDVNFVKDETVENTYNITVDDGTISDSAMFDKIAALTNLEKITVVSGETTLTYNVGDDLEAFKTSVDALCPKSNTDDPVVLTMTVTVK